ncbi:MAG: Hint domain-containing protein, partial [Pseudomonadota bacterium]
MVQASELDIDEGASALEMANAIFGDGVSVIGASYTGDNRSSGIFSGGDDTSPGVVPSDTGVILSTGRVRDFTNNNGDANQSNSTSTNTQGQNNNADFNAVAGRSTYDAAYMDVDFTTTGDTMTMQFVFASDEYPEYVNSIYNDVFAVWINGTYVPLEVGNGDTAVTEINQADTENLYVDNTQSQFNTEMDGFTVTMTLTIPVIPTTDPNNPVVNSIRIGIADASDSSYDSSVLIAGDSVQTAMVAIADDVTIGTNFTKTIDVLANDQINPSPNFEITHINGNEIQPNQSITLATGQTITLNSDWTIDVQTTGDTGEVAFTYTIEDNGITDTAFVTLDTIPCFVAGTAILTPEGERPVETLSVGDMVMTHDNGPQEIRWIGSRTLVAQGKHAPIAIRAGALGDHRTLLVSPHHRILIRDLLSELLFGEPEVLVSAKDLVNDRSIRPREGGEVTYVHMLFDQHEIVFSEGLATESFLPGPQTADCFEQAVLDEICDIFPELDPNTGE